MFLVYGLQKSGISVAKLLIKKNKEIKIWDDDIKIRKNLKKIFNKKLFLDPIREDLNSFEKIYVSPGISLKQKKFKLKNKSVEFYRDLNLYTSYLNFEKIIAITGTNGKSTTTKLIGNILTKNKRNTFIGGNIGEPLCNALIRKKKFNFHVIELSSFQLERTKNFNPNISIITNLANDHLDRYNDINDYINQKKKIITKNGINLISIDDKYSKKIFTQKTIKNKISFSLFNKSANVYMGENYILDNYFKKNRKLYINKISKDLEGHFNYQNILITYICCKLLKLSEKNFLNVIKNFRGLPFRSKIIFDNKKLKIINNSKSTNINSTISSIKNYDNIYLILGGIAKEENFKLISKFKNRIICIYVFGTSASFIQDKLRNSLQVKKFKSLKLLLQKMFKDIKNINVSSNILFAPACSSYDQYKNFEHRGKEFTKLINEQIKKL